MSNLQVEYDAETATAKRRTLAAHMLGGVLLALQEFPPFKSDMVHLPLKDMMMLFSDLKRGRDHPWAKPVHFSGTNVTTTAQEELRSYVRATFEILRGTGHKPKAAFCLIADGLTKHGREGRNGGPVPWRTVQQWCRGEGSDRDAIVMTRLANFWADYACQLASVKVVDAHGLPVSGREIAAAWCEKWWSMTHLRDRINSGG